MERLVDAFRPRNARKKQRAVSFLDYAPVEDDDRPPVVASSDKPPESLTEFYHRIRNAQLHERVPPAF